MSARLPCLRKRSRLFHRAFASHGRHVAFRDVTLRRVPNHPEHPSNGVCLISPAQGTLDYSAFGSVDMVIEAALEDLPLKQQIFADLEKACRRWVGVRVCLRRCACLFDCEYVGGWVGVRQLCTHSVGKGQWGVRERWRGWRGRGLTGCRGMRGWGSVQPSPSCPATSSTLSASPGALALEGLRVF